MNVGPVFVHRANNNYHVCVQDRKNKDCYEVVVDCRDPLLAEKIKDMLLAQQ